MDELSGQGDLRDLFDARRRIVAAFEEIAAGAESMALALDGGAPAPGTADAGAAAAADPALVARLRAEVEEERVANAQLAERVRVLRERQDDRVAALEEDLAQACAELARLREAHAADRAEMDAILAELIPLVEEAT